MGAGLEYEVWLGAQADLGTYSTGVGASAHVQVGWNLPKIRSVERNSYTAYSFQTEPTDGSFYVYAGAEGSYLPHQLSLSGGVFRSFTTEITPRPLIAEWVAGLAYSSGPYHFSAGYVWRTEEYEEQGGSHEYGFFTLAYQL